MNWIRRNEQPRLRAIALARTVLPVPGHVLDEQVAAAQQGDEGEADLVVLADDDALDVGEDLVAGLLDLGHRPLSRARASARVTPRSGGVARGFDGLDGGAVCRQDSTSCASEPVPGALTSVRIDAARRRKSFDSCRAPSGRLSRGAGSAPRPRPSSGSRSPPITARNGSPPTQDAAATPPNMSGEDEGDGGQPDPLDDRPRLARRRGGSRRRRPSASVGHRVARQVAGHQVARDRRRDLAAAAALLDEDRDRDRRVLGRREPDEPRVRLARAAELGRPGLAGRRSRPGPSRPA